MKTKDLIEELKKLDPEGEIDVVVNGEPIYFVERSEAYWDGTLNKLVQNDVKDYWNIIGYKFTDKGMKLNIKTMRLCDVLLNLMDKKMKTDDIIIEMDVDGDVIKEGIVCHVREIVEELRNEVFGKLDKDVNDVYIICKGEKRKI